MSDEERYAKAFDDIFDTDGSGSVSRDELSARLKERGKSDEEIEQMFIFCDLNRDNNISKKEFVSALTKNTTAENWKRVFNKFDTDGNGYLEAPEFIVFLGDCGMPEQQLEAAKNYIKEHDLDSDNKISFKEFLKFLNRA
ncbi:16 kDa calcium-binding protein-like [Tubulanus polymorphus]|uniref:16 kDa calcium-binding protein-like n=1 Tax=Tubulanus polymorphus TaxID=672921 RepID=UPI003DA537C8